MLRIPRVIHDAMVGHCVEVAPEEGCGILAGREEGAAEAIYPLRNALKSATRYDADPRDLIAAIQAMRARGERMVAIYHSHPESPAIPSRVDLAENHYGALPRIIVSLQGAVPVVRNWRLGATDCVEIPLSIDGEIESERLS